MKKDKILVQVIICLAIVLSFNIFSRIDNKTLNYLTEKGTKEVMRNLSFDDIKDTGNRLVAAIMQTPSKVVSAVVSANKVGEYGEPIDEKSDGNIKHVHATSGGMVLCSGIDKKIGLYIKIQHEDAISVYGNLCDINVVESERVKRGEIIGSYDTKSETDFYYNLEDLN
ncbi:MAG: M23 family metallopeptidase [Anaerovoracaceae bacterium]